MMRKSFLIALSVYFMIVALVPNLYLQPYYNLAGKLLLTGTLLIFILTRFRILTKADIPVWLFLCTLVPASFYARDPETAIHSYALLSVPLICFFYWSVHVFSDTRNIIRFARVVTVTATILSLGAFIEIVLGRPLVLHRLYDGAQFMRFYTEGSMVRPTVTLLHPAVFGGFLLTTLPLQMINITQSSKSWRPYLITTMGISLLAALLTLSHGVFIVTVALFATFLVIRKKTQPLMIFFLALLGIMTVCTFLPFPFNKYGWHGFFFDLKNLSSGLISPYRIERLITGLRMVSDEPLFGVGLENVRACFMEYFPGHNIEPPPYLEFQILDNMYLTMLAETGIVGFFGFAVFMMSLVKRMYSALKVERRSQSKEPAAYVALSFLVVCIHMCAYELFYWPSTFYFFCIIAGMLYATTGEARMPEQEQGGAHDS